LSKGLQTRHLDNDPSNNHVSNLLWGTAKDQQLDKKLKNEKYKLTDEEYKELRNYLIDEYGY